MPLISREWYEIVLDVIKEANEVMTASLINPLHGELPAISVQDLAADFFEKMRGLVELTTQISLSRTSASETAILEDGLVPVFKGLFLRARLSKARELDQQRSRTTNPQIISALEEKLNVYDAVIRETWFQTATPEYPPALSDVLTLERVESLDVATHFAKRQYDEKFHLLQAPTLLLQDLHYYRAKCGMRGISVAIGFVDIDNFKDFNTSAGHTHIDRHVLPVFMRALETHIFGHGFAYRYGGEEYVLLMPNTEINLAMDFLQRLRKRVGTLIFHGVDKSITVSVGLCVADQDCHLTDEELLHRAERAMNFAKAEGKDRIAGYIGRLFDESELRILSSSLPSGA
ncbi:MAG: GGDEF domain-containing protein [Gemmataceae bacterium]|nr:GGDEF domain-containing protein [Gemmataceae bacterium]MCI0742051.1 GGDEF domain-containing protein [Gemmataceae bacterium]